MKLSRWLLLAVIFCMPALVEALTYDGVPSKDTMLGGGGHTTKNFGASYWGDAGNWDQPYYRFIAQWDLPGDLAGQTVLSATLEFDVRETSLASGQTTVDLFVGGIEHDWVEGTGNGTIPADGATDLTYDGTNAWTFLAPLTQDGGSHKQYDTAQVPNMPWNANQVVGQVFFDDITELVQEWADGRPNYGLALAKDESQDGSINVFLRNAPGSYAPNQGPRLHIEYTPEPATMLLLGIGGLFLRRKK